MNDDEFIIVICQSGTIYTLAGDNSDKIRLGVSPLCLFFGKQMAHFKVPVAHHHQSHSSIHTDSTKGAQDVSVPASPDQQLPIVGESTEGAQDVSISASPDQQLPIVGESTEEAQDVSVPVSPDQQSPIVGESTEGAQDGVDDNECNEGKSPIINNTIIDGNVISPSPDTEEDCEIFPLHSHDTSFEMDSLDEKLLTLQLNSSCNSVSCVEQINSQAHDVPDSSSEEFTGFNPSDIPSSSDTEVTDTPITISDDDDNSTSHTTATTDILDSDEDLSNCSNAILPSVAESDDFNIRLSDADGMSEEISLQTNGNAVPPCHEYLTDDFSEDEIDQKLLLIQQFPNQIKANRG